MTEPIFYNIKNKKFFNFKKKYFLFFKFINITVPTVPLYQALELLRSGGLEKNGSTVPEGSLYHFFDSTDIGSCNQHHNFEKIFVAGKIWSLYHRAKNYRIKPDLRGALGWQR